MLVWAPALVCAVLCCAEAYDILHVLGGLTNDEIAAVFAEWNSGELQVRRWQEWAWVMVVVCTAAAEYGASSLLEQQPVGPPGMLLALRSSDCGRAGSDMRTVAHPSLPRIAAMLTSLPPCALPTPLPPHLLHCIHDTPSPS